MLLLKHVQNFQIRSTHCFINIKVVFHRNLKLNKTLNITQCDALNQNKHSVHY